MIASIIIGTKHSTSDIIKNCENLLRFVNLAKKNILNDNNIGYIIKNEVPYITFLNNLAVSILSKKPEFKRELSVICKKFGPKKNNVDVNVRP